MELENAGRLVSSDCCPSSTESGLSVSHGSDLPPEFCHYPDEGCELAGSCLKCPFPRCAYDRPGGGQELRKRLRDKEIVKLFAGGTDVGQIATRFGVSQRTIYRALRRARNE